MAKIQLNGKKIKIYKDLNITGLLRKYNYRKVIMAKKSFEIKIKLKLYNLLVEDNEE